MRLSQVIKDLQEIKRIHGDLPCVAAADDEGNAFSKVIYNASAGYFDYNDFTPDSELETDIAINAVCLN